MYPEVEVRQNNSNGQKLVTVPKESGIEPGDKVRLVSLGKNWDLIPAHLKAHHNIRELIDLSVKASKPLKGEGEEFNNVDAHLEEAGKHMDKALEVIEDERTVYADVSTEELQESCPHNKLEKEENGWRCQDCKKVLNLS